MEILAKLTTSKVILEYQWFKTFQQEATTATRGHSHLQDKQLFAPTEKFVCWNNFQELQFLWIIKEKKRPKLKRGEEKKEEKTPKPPCIKN
ncbi:hypothetical protein E1A91_D13G159600v1 [Gossypium mustelinum]|uniref:Uncharacterized protein n=1 Tax=Gossypium mustelinum TaxID=34275 RepID=A0A5D2S4G8_GOSMU|nr:hypothetical protein E1A91_D13G159600v1 [Gossypium mustelinum]